MANILLTTDFSKESTTAFAQAKKQLDLLGSDATIEIVTVIEDAVVTNLQFEFGITVIDTEGILKEAEEQAEKKIAAVAKEHFESYNAKTKVIRGERTVYDEILSYADSSKADMIVIATHGRSGIPHLLLGSVAERVVRGAKIPVLVVPCGPEDED